MRAAVAAWIAIAMPHVALARSARPQPGPAPDPLRVAVSGATSSFDLELLALFAASQRLELERVAEPAAAASADVVAGRLASDTGLAGRALTTEVFPTRIVAVTRRPTAVAASIASLHGARVAVVRGSRSLATIRDAAREVAILDSPEEALAALRSGDVTSVLLELPEALVARRADAALQLGAFLGERESYVFAVRPEKPELARKLDLFLQQARSRQSWLPMLARHYGLTSLHALASTRFAD